MLTDEQLFQGIANGNRDCLAMLYDKYESMVFSFAMRCVSDPMAAEEVVQDVFTKVWRANVVYDPARAKPSTWLLSIARNVAIDHLRRKRGGSTAVTSDDSVLEHVPSSGMGPETIAQMNEVRGILAAALNELPVEQREPIRRMYLQGMTQQEIADLCKLPVGTIKSRIRLGLGKLRHTLLAVGLEEVP